MIRKILLENLYLWWKNRIRDTEFISDLNFLPSLSFLLKEIHWSNWDIALIWRNFASEFSPCLLRANLENLFLFLVSNPSIENKDSEKFRIAYITIIKFARRRAQKSISEFWRFDKFIAGVFKSAYFDEFQMYIERK